jgi:tRNA 2-thiouridine synthesizing protein A
MMERDTELRLDLSGLRCPLPVLKAGKVLRNLPSGSIVTVLASDPLSAIDMPHFCTEQGHHLISSDQDGDTFIFRIKRK